MHSVPSKTRLSRVIKPLGIAIFFIALAVAGITAYNLALGSITSKSSTLYIPEGTSFEALIDSLSAGEKVTNTDRFRKAANAMKRNNTINSGRYELKRGMSAGQLVNMIHNRKQSPLNVTFNNIRTIPQFAATLGRILMADSTQFAKILSSDSIAASYGFTSEEFIGMFIPNTYQFYWTVGAEEFVARMNKEYRRFWNEERRAQLERTGLNEKQVATLASIVDEETSKKDEMATIAGVYINRLHIGMPLQADPTVKYALGDFSLKRILRKHLTVESPYNTYQNRGLPPGPIRMPSIAAIDAVLNYDANDYLYFCAKSDFSGYHTFAKTLPEHNRNARAYAAALNRKGIK